MPDTLQVGSNKVKYGLAMPILLTGRRWFLTDLHHMCVYFEEKSGTKGEPAEFRKVVLNAFLAEDWFRFHCRCTDPTNTIQVVSHNSRMRAKCGPHHNQQQQQQHGVHLTKARLWSAFPLAPWSGMPTA